VSRRWCELLLIGCTVVTIAPPISAQSTAETDSDLPVIQQIPPDAQSDVTPAPPAPEVVDAAPDIAVEECPPDTEARQGTEGLVCMPISSVLIDPEETRGEDDFVLREDGAYIRVTPSPSNAD
jgi:hypothetical protein